MRAGLQRWRSVRNKLCMLRATAATTCGTPSRFISATLESTEAVCSGWDIGAGREGWSEEQVDGRVAGESELTQTCDKGVSKTVSPSRP